MGEDPTVNALEEFAADLFGKERALFCPTGTMANLAAILSHCHYNKSSEIIIGAKSHINLYEGSCSNFAIAFPLPYHSKAEM